MNTSCISSTRLRLQRHIIAHFFAPVITSLHTARSVSTTSAIKRGLRESEYSDGIRPRKTWQDRGVRREPSDRRARQDTGYALRSSSRGENTSHSKGTDPFSGYGRHNGRERNPVQPFRTISDTNDTRPHRAPKTDNFDNRHPVSIPYTTAASEFLYGAHAVLAALRARRRKLYTLYFGRKEGSSNSSGESQNASQSIYDQITRLSHLPDLKVNRHADRAILDKISSNRNHQNIALECSRLPYPPLASLGLPTFDTATNVPSIPLTFAETKRSPEDVAIDGDHPTLALARSHIKPWHKPLVVFLDGILDPQNIGNILRTCHFYNVTAVAIATNTCAPISSATLAKASSGACEAVPLFAVPRPSDFIYQSARAGWRVHASVAPTGDWGASVKENSKAISTADVKRASPLAKKPTILMLGAEGEGLRKNLLRHADGLVSIMPPGGARSPKHDVGVDSLNVGTAAGVLLEAYYTQPLSGNQQSQSSGGDKVW